MDWEAFYREFREPGFIPGFELENRLGGGAFGEVYKARRPSIGKAYAIKFLKVEDGAPSEAIARELEQVRLFAAIDHPNLVSIEDVGVAGGVPYLVMGYAGEETLARRMRGGALSPEEALALFTQTCRGVLALHDRRLAHFDLKPGNVFLNGDAARVGDYGLSKLLVEGRQTLSFGRGTPHYMAPEMLRGRGDLRADIYSLGVILYEALLGRVPFEADSASGVVLREQESSPEFPEDFPEHLRGVIERCLRLDPDERFGGVAELLEALGQAARPGDSIRFEAGSLPRRGRSVAEAASTPQPSPLDGVGDGVGEGAASETRPARDELAGGASELHETAADLARGAALVARGVWDGLRTPGEAAGTAQARAVPAGVPAGRRATIPVPPVGTGALGALRTATALSIEISLTVVRGGLRWATRGFALARDRVDTRESALVWRILRLGAFFLFLAVVGGLIMFLLLLALSTPLGL